MDSTTVNLIIAKFDELARTSTSVFTSSVWPLLVRRQLIWGITGVGTGILLLVLGGFFLPLSIKRLKFDTPNEEAGWIGGIIAASVVLLVGLIILLTSIPQAICPECEALSDLLRATK
jgi:hypothetical protein